MSEEYVNKSMIAQLREHVLSVVLDVPGCKIFRLGPNKPTGIMVTRLIFTSDPAPDQIIITGDLNPGDHGLVGICGYGLDFFSRPLSTRYLCEKFLRVGYQPEAAVQALKTRGRDLRQDSGHVRTPADTERRRKIAEAIDIAKRVEAGDVDDWDNPFRSFESFATLYIDIFGTTPDLAGIDYDPRAAGWLVAIQRRFAELYQAQLAAAAPAPAPALLEPNAPTSA